VETITIDRAADGAFWAAYPVGGKEGRTIVVRKLSSDLKSPPGERIPLAEGLFHDDICAVTAFDGGVGVMWSDQNSQAVRFRRHLPNTDDANWQPAETVAKGNKAADDHVNFCRPRGKGAPKLIAATKTSLDTPGKPLLALRVLTAEGQWRNVPYATMPSAAWGHTRPIVLWLKNRPVSLYSGRHFIALQEFSSDGLRLRGPDRRIIEAENVNNVTGPKTAPRSIPCLVLASNQQGKIYEAILDLPE